MKLGRIIGRVTLNVQVPALKGGRFLVATPLTRDMIERHGGACDELSAAPTPVVYDEIGASIGDVVGYIEGREAAMPFDRPVPIDAYCAAIIDRAEYFAE